MKIRVNKPIEVEAGMLRVTVKALDEFSATLLSRDGVKVCSVEQGNVPGFFPRDCDGGSHFGEYLFLDIDLETGHIKNWKTPSASDVQGFVDECSP